MGGFQLTIFGIITVVVVFFFFLHFECNCIPTSTHTHSGIAFFFGREGHRPPSPKVPVRLRYLIIQLNDTWSFSRLFAIFFCGIKETGDSYFSKIYIYQPFQRYIVCHVFL